MTDNYNRLKKINVHKLIDSENQSPVHFEKCVRTIYSITSRLIRLLDNDLSFQYPTKKDKSLWNYIELFLSLLERGMIDKTLINLNYTIPADISISMNNEIIFEYYINLILEDTPYRKQIREFLDSEYYLGKDLGFEVDDINNTIVEDVNGINLKLEKIEKTLNTDLDEFNDIKEKIKSIFNEATSFGKETIMKEYVASFENLSINYSETAVKWRNGIIWYSIILCLAIFLGFFDYVSIGAGNIILMFIGDKVTNTADISLILTSQLVSKAVAYALAIFLLLFIVKQYLIHKNLQTINKHKSTALNSYYLFKETVDKDDKSMNIIMEEVARLIYSDISSGFLKDSDTKMRSGLGSLVSNVIKESKDMT